MGEMRVCTALLPGVTLPKSVLCVPCLLLHSYARSGAATPSPDTLAAGLREKCAGKLAWGAWPQGPARLLPGAAQDRLPLGNRSILSMTKETAVSGHTRLAAGLPRQIWCDPGYTANRPQGPTLHLPRLLPTRLTSLSSSPTCPAPGRRGLAWGPSLPLTRGP